MIDLPQFPSNVQLDGDESLRILLVDDEPSTLQLVRKVLQADGHEIFEAIDGQQAIEVFDAIRPDLVLLDIVIPKMDGLAVLEKIRETDKVAGVIMVSALSSEQLAVRSMLAGADDYVSKPFKLRKIRLNIRRVMDKVRLRRHNIELQQKVDEANDKLRDIFKLYMAPSVAEELLKEPSLPQLGGERKLVTVMFMDICDFTPLAHQLQPDEVLNLLNEYLALVTTPVPENGGFLDKIMGDGFMALFPEDRNPNHATDAVRCATIMYRQVAEYNQQNNSPVNISIGINTGIAVVGNIGTEEMMNYTAIGDEVNLAKRLQESGEDGQILISGSTRDLLDADTLYGESIDINMLGPRVVKGRATPVDVYHVYSNGRSNGRL
ncbi:MAG: adenylate/guanylate cyclase domain-containing protein [Chloroflexota bacterium]